jgi:hypothetical protein
MALLVRLQLSPPIFYDVKMKNLNPYNRDIFQKEFEATDTYSALAKRYDVVSFEKFIENMVHMYATPRQQISLSHVSAVPWYYLNYLDTQQQVVDLGCGCNFFKPYFSNFVGIGAESDPDQFFGDAHDFVDDVFFKGHVNAYHSVFSINSLHYRPLEDLRELCINFANMISPKGKGFLALNAMRMLRRSQTLRYLSNQALDEWIRQQFDNFPVDIEVLDIDLSVPGAYIDGNIRVVFSK